MQRINMLLVPHCFKSDHAYKGTSIRRLPKSPTLLEKKNIAGNFVITFTNYGNNPFVHLTWSIRKHGVFTLKSVLFYLFSLINVGRRMA